MTSAAMTDLIGVWKRTLLVDSDGHEDRRPGVCWVQGPTLYVDLRIVGGSVEGFSGSLVRTGNLYQWRRDIDIGPEREVPDAGTLHFDGDVLVETGFHEDYAEHWERGDHGTARSGGMVLANGNDNDNDNDNAILVWVGSTFGFARSDMVEMGEIDAGRWMVTRSSYESRSGTQLGVTMSGGCVDIDERRWTVIESEGVQH